MMKIKNKQTIFQQENIDDISCWHKCHFGGAQRYMLKNHRNLL